MNITEKIVQMAAPYSAVAFDVFDTLLKRDVATPSDLFLLQGKEFAARRIQAEKEVRAASQREVTLAEIYATDFLEGDDPAKECALELAAAAPNYPVWRAVRILHSQKKRIYFISDMYLPTEQISAMLTNCGYEPFDGGFVSCSYGVQKRSGALFRRFLHETGLKASQVLFIGDSWRADVIGAALGGIRAWHLPDMQRENLFPKPEDYLSGAVQAFVQNRLAGRANAGEALGFAVLGPLLVAFCQWLHEQCSKNGGRLFFLARDMYLAREIYELLYPDEETRYLQVSRRSLCPLLLQRQDYTFLAAALPRQALTGKQIAAYCGTDCPEPFQNKMFSLKESCCSQDLISLLTTLRAPDSAPLAQEYLAESGLSAGDFLVDIGSGGTTQMLLERLCGFSLHGLQLSGDERLQRRPLQTHTEVFLTLENEEKSLYWAGQPMLEKLISQDTGATVGYIRHGGKVRVLTDSQETCAVVAQLQCGALDFARDWTRSVLSNIQIPSSAAIAFFLHLFRCPTEEQTVLLGDLEVEDGAVYPLATPKALGWYLLHPQKAAGDFSEARWKIGFLKRLLRLPLPYDRLYLAMKK